MKALIDLPDLDQAAVELLDAVGVTTIRELAKTTVEDLRNEMLAANSHLQLVAEVPARERLGAWIAASVEEVSQSAPSPEKAESDSPVASGPEGHPHRDSFKKDESGVVMAAPVPAGELKEAGLGVDDVPEAAILAPLAVPYSKGTTSPSRATPTKLPSARGEDVAPAMKPETPESLEPRGQTLVTTTREETNKGRSRHSRSFIRGVLHPQPGVVRFGGFFAFLALLLTPLTLYSAIAVLLGEPKIWLWAPVAHLAVCLGYLAFGIKPRCRICGQRLFVSKSCDRHPKAHHFFGLGYIVPTALHALLFRWMRCAYCGTAIRLKE